MLFSIILFCGLSLKNDLFYVTKITYMRLTENKILEL